MRSSLPRAQSVGKINPAQGLHITNSQTHVGNDVIPRQPQIKSKAIMVHDIGQTLNDTILSQRLFMLHH